MNDMTGKPKRKKQIDRQKVLYIIFSVVASIALWIYVAYVDNPNVPVTVSGIPIEFKGNELLADNDLAVTNVDAERLTIRFNGRRNTVTKLSNDNIRAIVDLSDVLKSNAGMTGIYQLSYSLDYGTVSAYGDIEVASASKAYISVTVEKMVTASVPVRGVYNGGVGEGYLAELPAASPETVTVAGPQSVVSKIAYAEAVLERANLTKSVTEAVPLVFYDENGKPVEDKNLIPSQETVNITLSVLMIKEIPLSVNTVYSASANESNTKVTINPAFITISGDPEELSEINQITLGTIDLTSFVTNTTETFPITPPNDTVNVTGDTTAEVTVEVIGKSTRKLSASNIEVKNSTDGYKETILTQSLDITLRGDEADINNVKPENIRVVADLAELGNTTGTFTVSAKVYVDGFTDVDAVGEYKVTVSITK